MKTDVWQHASLFASLSNYLAQIVTWWPCPLTFQLLPADAKIKEYHQKEADEAKAYVRKLSVVNLAEKSEEVKEPEVVKIDLVS